MNQANIEDLQKKYHKRINKKMLKNKKAKEQWYQIDINAYTNQSHLGQGKYIKGMSQCRPKKGKMKGSVEYDF